MTLYKVLCSSHDPAHEMLTDDPLRCWLPGARLYVVADDAAPREVTQESPEAADPRVRCCLAASVRSRDCGANIEWSDLRHADLSHGCLRLADLTGADLTGADLTGADLMIANLRGADLTGADLTEAFLLGADLTMADLTGADLTAAELTAAWCPSAIPAGWEVDTDGRLRRDAAADA